MKSWHEFITMGGYAVYVWSSYGIVLVVMLANAILPGRKQRSLLKQIARRLGRGDQAE